MNRKQVKRRIDRVFVIVLDSAGVGESPDAAAFGDEGSNTFRTISGSPKFHCPNLLAAGLGAMDGMGYLGSDALSGSVARLSEKSNGKDTTTGHWEIAGLVSDTPMPTFPDGFPDEVIDAFSAATGRGVLCNKPYSGTQLLLDYGREHLETGKLIVYTSADSVFQIAAHEDLVPVEQLYDYCRAARKILCGKYAVGRVIARPFIGEYPNYVRTAKRHDFSVEPWGRTLLDAVCDAGLDSIAVGKIHDIFAGRGMTDFIYTTSNADGMAKTEEVARSDFHGLCFVNLVDFDSAFGHRRDVDGYAAAMTEFDEWLGRFRAQMRPKDLLIITADHGCDPAFLKTTDHTREYIPCIMLGDKILPQNLGTHEGFANIAATVADFLGVDYDAGVKGFAKEIIK